MAKTKQLSITVDNKPGAAAEIVRTLGNAKVNILALAAWVEGPSGTVTVIVDDARRAKKALDEAKAKAMALAGKTAPCTFSAFFFP